MAHSVGRWVGLWLGTAAAFRSAPLLPSCDATAKFGRAAARMKFEVDPSLPLFPGAPGPGGDDGAGGAPGSAEPGRTLIDFSTPHPPQLVGAWKTLQLGNSGWDEQIANPGSSDITVLRADGRVGGSLLLSRTQRTVATPDAAARGGDGAAARELTVERAAAGGTWRAFLDGAQKRVVIELRIPPHREARLVLDGQLLISPQATPAPARKPLDALAPGETADGPERAPGDDVLIVGEWRIEGDDVRESELDAWVADADPQDPECDHGFSMYRADGGAFGTPRDQMVASIEPPRGLYS